MNIIVNELNKQMNFSYIIETVSNIAFDLTKSVRVREHRFNENALLVEDLKFECENFLYDIKKFPEITLESAIGRHEDLILEKFNKKEIFIENNKVEFYTFKEDENIVLFKEPMFGDLKVRFNNNFINEKTSLIESTKTDIRQLDVTSFLLKENTCAEVEGLSKVLSESKLEMKPIENFLLQENSILYATKAYETLKELHEDCEIAYNEVIKEGKIIPVITYIDILTEDVECIYTIECNESYKNHFNYSLNKIYED